MSLIGFTVTVISPLAVEPHRTTDPLGSCPVIRSHPPTGRMFGRHSVPGPISRPDADQLGPNLIFMSCPNWVSYNLSYDQNRAIHNSFYDQSQACIPPTHKHIYTRTQGICHVTTLATTIDIRCCCTCLAFLVKAYLSFQAHLVVRDESTHAAPKPHADTKSTPADCYIVTGVTLWILWVGRCTPDAPKGVPVKCEPYCAARLGSLVMKPVV